MTKTKKDELYEEAEKEYGVKLDRKLTLAQLEEQKAQLAKDKKNPPKPVKEPVPKLVKNVITGNVFEYNEIFKNNPDLQIIEWEEQDGDN